MEHSTLLTLISLVLSISTAVVAVAYAYGKLSQKVVAMERTAATLADKIKNESTETAIAIRRETVMAAETLKRENDTVIAYLNSAIAGIKSDCIRLREGCQTENCSKMDKIAEALAEGFKELREDRKEDVKKFELISGHIGRVEEYIRTHNG